MSAVAIGTVITPIRPDRVTVVEVPRDRVAPSNPFNDGGVSVAIKMESGPAILPEPLPTIVVHAPDSEGTEATGTAPKNEEWSDNDRKSVLQVQARTPRALVIFRQQDSASNAVKGPLGLALPRKQNLIKNTGAYTSWYTHTGDRAIARPPMLHESLVVEIGDIFIYKYASKTFKMEVQQIWVLLKGDDREFRWVEAIVQHTRHPVLGDRILAFRQSNLMVPTWVLANTLRRFTKHPVVVKPGEGSGFL
ncbi:hypothetical protein BV25DRAFT_1919439 [Artomyces pyxidatus]|uniref:Uncharacterized protein n=1 Tax=Artomyces pyxidatus TaxID=48021 RepID=A0ACB8SQN0_9AGAM|nr:hypothetical protein BV25DRAFT_1919439 [Artomyces pyxidatus]